MPQNSTVTITIPVGVKVLRVYISAQSGDFPHSVAQGIISYTKEWGSALSTDGDGDSSINFIGVTPGKTYKLKYVVEIDRDDAVVGFEIAYSAGINNTVPDVIDY